MKIMKTLKNLIKVIKNGKIYTNNYVEFQDATFEIATQKVEFGQDRHSKPGTANKFIIELPEVIEAEGNKYKSMTFVDDSNSIYLNLDFDTALDCAELDGWFEEYSKLNQTIFDSIIFDNIEYVKEDGRSTEEYHLTSIEECPEGWDCVFPGCPSWCELDEYHREYRKKTLIDALNNY